MMKISTIIGLVICISVIALVVFELSPAGGSKQALTVMSDSMRPEIKSGDIIIIEHVDPADIWVGDIVTYAPQKYGVVITHRVIDIEANGDFLTQGDAVATVDINPVKPDQIIGKHVMTIPMLGYLTHYARQPIGFIIMIVIPIILLIAIELKKIIDSGDKKVYNENRSERVD